MTSTRTAWIAALLASALLHGGLGAAVARAPRAGAALAPAVREMPERWAGTTMDVVEVSTETAAPAAPPVGLGAPAAVAAVPAPARPTTVRERAAPAPRPATNTPAAEDPAAILARRILEYRPPSGHSAGGEPPAAMSGHAAAAEKAGSDGAQAAKRSLARAFTRAFPAANTGDPVWDRLPLGRSGSIVVVLRLDEEGAVIDAEERNPPRPPAHLSRSVERTLLMLRGGRFAAAPGARLGFRLDVTLSARPAESGPLALGFETPRADKAGRAYFQLPSGRFVDVAVSLVGS